MGRSRTPHRDSFDHRKLDIYRLSLEFFREARVLALRLRGPDSVIRNQLLRARGSANECVAILDILEFVLGMTPAQLEPYYAMLRRIIVMLVALDKTMQTRADIQKNTPSTIAPRPTAPAGHQNKSVFQAPTRDPPT